MKGKKSLYSINIALLFLILLTGSSCSKLSGEPPKETFQPGVYTMDDLKIIDTKQNVTISLGMKKSEVTELLGQETEIGFKNIYNYNGLEIYYRDNVVAVLMVKAGDNVDKRYVTARGLALGTSLNEAVEKYGDVEIDNSYGAFFITYVGRRVDNQIITTNEAGNPTGNDDEESEWYVLSFSFFDNSNRTMSNILISDKQFSMNMD